MRTLLNWIIGLIAAGSSIALAEPGLYYDADNPGHGLTITQDTGEGHAVIWYLYREDGSSAFLTGLENCSEFPCVIPLVEPQAVTAFQFYDLGEPVGVLELTKTDGGFEAKYDLRPFLNCIGQSSGGTIFRRCIGTINLSKLAE